MPHSGRKNVSCLTDPDITIETVGGKAVNLAEMTRDGFRVPPAFAVTVDAYDSFITDTGLRERIGKVLSDIDFDDEKSLSEGTENIRSMIAGRACPNP